MVSDEGLTAVAVTALIMGAPAAVVKVAFAEVAEALPELAETTSKL